MISRIKCYLILHHKSLLIINLATIFFILIGYWFFRTPEYPRKWDDIHIGMTKSEVYAAMHWRHIDAPHSLIVIEQFGTAPLLSYRDVFLEIHFSFLEGRGVNTLKVKSYSIYYSGKNWFERVQSRYSTYGLKIWKWEESSMKVNE